VTSPDVAVGLKPVLSFFRDLSSYDSSPEYKGEFYMNKGIDAMCKFALARGTVSDVLAVIEVLYDNHGKVPNHEYPIGGFFKYFMNFEPQDTVKFWLHVCSTSDVVYFFISLY
jgi:hypothetical protein